MMKSGDLRRFSDSWPTLVAEHLRGRVFMVLEVSGTAGWEPTRVDILIDGRRQTDLGFHWVEQNSEALNAAG
jgi:hypothetical protein